MRRFASSIVLLAALTLGAVVWIANEPRVQQALGGFVSRYAQSALGLPMHVAWVFWNPLSGTIRFGDTVFYDTERDSWLELPLIEVDLRWGELRLPSVSIDRVTLHGLRLHLHVDANGNVAQLEPIMAAVAAWNEDAAAAPVALQLAIDRVRLLSADVRVTVQEPWMEFRARDLNAEVVLEDLKPVRADVDLRGGMYQILDWCYDGIKIRGAATFDQAGVTYQDVSVRIDRPRIDLEVDGTVRLDGAEPLLTIQAGGPADVALVNQHYTDIPTLLGTVQVFADIAIGSEGDLDLRGEVAADAIEVQQRLVRDVRGGIRLNAEGMSFERFHADLLPGALSVTGTIHWADSLDLNLYPRLDGAELDWLARFFGPIPAQPQGDFSGDVWVGVRDVPQIVVDVHARGGVRLERALGRPLPRAFGDTPARVDVALRAYEDAFWLERAKLSHPLLAAAVTAFAGIAVTTPYAVSAVVDLEDLGWVAEMFAIEASGAASVESALGPRGANLTARISELHAYQTHWDSAVAVVDLDKARVDVREFVLERDGGSARGAVQVDLDSGHYQGWTRFTSLPLAKVATFARLSGRARGDLVFWGDDDLLLPLLRGQAQITDLAVAQVPLGDVVFSGVERGGMLYGHLRARDGILTAILDPQRLAGSLAATVTAPVPAEIATWLGVNRLTWHAHGQIAPGHTLIQGFASNPVTIADVVLGSFLWTGDATSAFLWLDGTTLQGHIGGRYARDDETVLAGRLSLRRVPPGAEPWLDTLSASLSLSWVLPEGDWTRTHGRIDLVRAVVGLSDFSAHLAAPVAARIAAGQVRLLDAARIVADQIGELTLSGGVDLGRAWNLAATGQLPLKPVLALPIGIRDVDGLISGRGTLTGAWERPQWRADGRLVANRLVLTYLDSPIEDLSGAVTFDGRDLEFKAVEGRIGDGTLRLDGRVGLLGLRRGNVGLRLALDVPRLQVDGKLTTAAVGALSLDGSWLSDLVLSGDIEVSALRYVDEIAWELALLKLRNRVVEPEPLSLAQDPRLNVRIRGTRDLRVDTNLLDGAFRVDLTVGGSLRFPRYFGSIEFDRDSLFFFRNQIYSLRRGTVQYADAGGRKPFVDIEAVTAVWYEQANTPRTEYRILLNILGPIDKLNVAFTSEPPLEEGEILSLLSLGVLPSDLETSADGSGLQFGGYQASSLLLSSQISRIEQEIQAIIGFDRLEIEPAFNNAGGHSSMQVTVQKRLGNRLNLRLSTGLESNANQRIELGYRVGRGLDLSIGWDNADTDNASEQLDVGNFFTRPRLVFPLP